MKMGSIDRFGWKTLLAWSLLVVLVYVPGLQGPALLDDVPNIGPIIQWAQGESAENPLLAERKSGPLGRPLSLISFMANATTTGNALWPMKLTNVLLHVLTGLALFGFLRAVLRRDDKLKEHAHAAAWVSAALWMLLPQHIVTVLYTVQRMSVLAALFSVLALWSYACARERMEKSEAGVVWRLFAMLMFSALAVLSKESALVLPLLLVVVEWGFYSPRHGQSRPSLAKATALMLGILPAVAAVLWLIFHPEYVLRGYDSRDFTLYERILTQARILWEYVYSTFLPLGRTANVYNDNYQLSHGLVDPPVTALALLGWALLPWVLWRIRRYKTIVTSILFFIAAHVLESTIFPLEIYFVHRNYLPSMGLVVAMVAAAFVIWPSVVRKFVGLRRWMPAIIGCILAAFAVSAASRAHLWGSQDRLHAHAQIYNPESLRLQTDLLRVALETGQPDLARRRIRDAAHVAPESEQRTVVLWDIFSHCHLGEPVPQGRIDDFLGKPAGRITNYANLAMLQLRSSVMAGQCTDLDGAKLASAIADWADNSPQSPGHRNIWEARGVAATLFTVAEKLNLAQAQIDMAYAGSGYRFELGIFALQVALGAGNETHAREIFHRLSESSDPAHQEQLRAVRELMGSVDDVQTVDE